MFLISSFVVIFFLMVNEILSNCLNMISIKLKIGSWTYSVINTWLKRGEGQFILLVEKSANEAIAALYQLADHHLSIMYLIVFSCVMRGHGFSVYVLLYLSCTLCLSKKGIMVCFIEFTMKFIFGLIWLILLNQGYLMYYVNNI